MIITKAPQNEAIMSNVGEIGEFRIRNSAKAFNILSSGLYANKIKAIIRELSCNAIDSHVAAGRIDTPFDVHLPNDLEPWFAIRDYGTGLSHDQVSNIYTTYFESTKTDSNDFIGALGLGSKSPFSYTDNFTVTAIKDGRKGIYTAFINEQGVPSIALMMEEETTDPSGVEVKFSVNDRWDFSKFRDEARAVYKWFKQRPVVSGYATFTFSDVEYIDKDIIPGVHSAEGSASYAVMGNIAYRIELPEANRKDLSELYHLLGCGLVMEFAIGELDFQASREGLSYIPQTIEAIKNKLESLNNVLTIRFADEANKIDNLWERAVYISEKRSQALWRAAIVQYLAQNPLPTYSDKHDGGPRTFKLGVDSIARKYNISIRGLQKHRGQKTITNLKNTTEYGKNRAKKSGHYITWDAFSIRVEKDCHFIINDLRTGAVERAKHHYRETPCDVYCRNVYVLEPADKTKPMLLNLFFDKIQNPPEARIFPASSLLAKERKSSSLGKDVTIMRLEERGGRNYHRSREMVWRDAGKADEFDSNRTYYYVPLSGFNMISDKGYSSGKELLDEITSVDNLFEGSVYGVRKTDLEWVKQQVNWVNLEVHIARVLKASLQKTLMSIVKSSLDDNDIMTLTDNAKVCAMIDPKSPYAKFMEVFKNVPKTSANKYTISKLCKRFLGEDTSMSPDDLIVKYQAELTNVNARYPLLSKLNSYRVKGEDIAEYINLIDAKKGF